MAQALAEQILQWQPSTWPPRTALPNTPSFEIEGTVIKHYALNIRKANESQGFLKQTVTNDVNSKYRAVQIKVYSFKQLPSGTAIVPVSGEKLTQAFGAFQTAVTGVATPNASLSQHLLADVSNQTVTVWADATLLSELSAKADGKPVELVHAYVKVVTEGSTLVAKSFDLLQQAADNKNFKAPSLDSQPNLFAKAGAAFNPAAAAAVGAKPKKKDDDDDWDD